MGKVYEEKSEKMGSIYAVNEDMIIIYIIAKQLHKRTKG